MTGKMIMSVLKKDVISSAGSLHACEGKRLDAKQLCTLWRKFSKKNQQRQIC